MCGCSKRDLNAALTCLRVMNRLPPKAGQRESIELRSRKRIGAMLKNLAAAAGVVAAATLAANTARAAGFALQEQADGLAGAAYVGMGAAAQDASTAYYNPAGMTALPRAEFELGARYIGITASFHNDGPLPQTGGTGGAAGMKLAARSLYYIPPPPPTPWAALSFHLPLRPRIPHPPHRA